MTRWAALALIAVSLLALGGQPAYAQASTSCAVTIHWSREIIINGVTVQTEWPGDMYATTLSVGDVITARTDTGLAPGSGMPGFLTDPAPWRTIGIRLPDGATIAVETISTVNVWYPMAGVADVYGGDPLVNGEYYRWVSWGYNAAGAVEATWRILGFNNCGEEPPPDLVRPLGLPARTAALIGQTTISSAGGSTTGPDNQSAVIFGSDTTGQRVSAVAGGIVSDIRPFDASLCGQLAYRDFSGPCSLTLNSRLSTPASYPPISVVIRDEVMIWDVLPNPDIYAVEISTDSGQSITQLVAHAPRYVEIGAEVEAGCWVGEMVSVPTYGGLAELASALNALAVAAYEILNPSAGMNSVTAVWVAEDGEYIDAWDRYTQDPTGDAPCNRTPSEDGCLGDSELRNPSAWEYPTDVVWETPGAILPPGAWLSANPPFNLAAGEPAELIVRARISSWGDSSVAMQLGATRATATMAGEIDQLASIPAAVHAPDLAGLYTVKLENTGSTTLQIYLICVRQPEDGTPPPEPGPPEPPAPPPAEGGEPVNEAGCTRVPFPDGESVASWTSWLWARLNRFFQCELMRTLRAIQDTIGNFFRMVGFSVRWNMASMQAAWNWAGNSLFPWLAGYLSNMQPGQVTVEAGCNSFWCALVEILGGLINGVISPIVNLITGLVDLAAQLVGQILSGIIDLIFSFINSALALLNIARLAFAGLLDAWLNTEPAEIPGWATCPAIPDSSSPLCLLFWVLENTAFTQAGALIIPLLTGWFSIHLVLWFINDIKQTFIKLGQAT